MSKNQFVYRRYSLNLSFTDKRMRRQAKITLLSANTVCQQLSVLSLIDRFAVRCFRHDARREAGTSQEIPQ